MRPREAKAPCGDPIVGVTFDGTQDLTIPRDRPLLAPLIRMGVLDLEDLDRRSLRGEEPTAADLDDLAFRAPSLVAAGTILRDMTNDSGLSTAEDQVAGLAADTLLVVGTVAALLPGASLPPGPSMRQLVQACYSLVRHVEMEVEEAQGLPGRMVVS